MAQKKQCEVKKMNVIIPNHLAVVGFSDYQGKINCVDGWFNAGDPRANAYGYIIEEAGDYIRVREMIGDQRAFLVCCGRVSGDGSHLTFPHIS